MLDVYTSGIYLYAKNIANLVGQFVLFIRRVEYRGVVRRTKAGGLGPGQLLVEQKWSLFVAVLACGGVWLVKMAVKPSMDGLATEIIDVASWLLILASLWVFVSSLGQGLIAKGDIRTYALAITGTSLLSGAAILGNISHYGLWAVYGAELGMYSGQGAIYWYTLIRGSRAVQH